MRSAPLHDKPPFFEQRTALLYAAIFLPTGIHQPYFSLWLAAASLSPAQISTILSTALFLRIIAGPAVSALADHARDRVPVLVATSILAALAACGYLLAPRFALILVVSLVLAGAWAPHAPLADSIAQVGVRRFGSDYPRMRVWGSISFLLANVAGGWILSRTGRGAVPWLVVTGFSLLVVVAASAPRLGRAPRAETIATGSRARSATIIGRPYVLLFIVAASVCQGSHALLNAFGTIYWTSVGLGEAVVGVLWAASVLAEVATFALFRRVLGRSRPSVLLSVGTGVGALRWMVYPLLGSAGVGLTGFVGVQLLHAFSYALVLLAMQQMLSETIPESSMGAAQGVAYFLTGAMLAALTLWSGPLYQSYGAASFYAMSAAAGLGFVLSLVCLRLEKGEKAIVRQ